MSVSPFLIGLAGGSGSGKTALARALTAKLPPGESATLELDSYYRDWQGKDPATVNFDEPAAFDYDLLLAHVQSLAGGAPVDKPVYDFNTHARLDRTIRIDPKRFVLLEGLFALHWPEIRSSLHLKLFIETDINLCLERRLARDLRERGRTPASIEAQFRDTVQPMFEKYVSPTRQFADLILDGGKNIEALAAEVAFQLDSTSPG